MKTRFLTALLVLLASGCRENLGSIAPFGVCAFPEDAAACEMEATCSRYLADRPQVWVLDAFGDPNELELWVQWNNQMPDNSDPTSGRVNTNTFYIEEYELEFETDALDPLNQRIVIPSFTTPATAPPVPAAGSTSSSVPVIPQEVLEFIAPDLPAGRSIVRVKLRAVGKLGDDSRYETGTLPIAVEIKNEPFLGYACPFGEVVTAVCPNTGQTSSWTCEAPPDAP